MKKLILTLLWTLSILLPTKTFAQNPEPYAVLEGNTLTFYYNDEKDAKGGMSVGPFYGFADRGWYEARNSITSVIFDASFANCTTLTTTAYWFYDCKNITSIEGISNLKTDNVTDMAEMFYHCSKLTELNLESFNTANVTTMNGMFSGCSGLTSLDVSGFKMDNVTYMIAMFSGCSSLTNLEFANFNAQNVTSMTYMFKDCSSLTSLDLSGFNTENVTDMYEMFYGCSSLTSLDVSSFKTENVTSMTEMFYNCEKLTTLNLSNFKTGNVTSMKEMFAYCSSLTSLDLSSFKTDNVTDMSYMFLDCSGLTSLNVSGFKTDKVTNMTHMFKGCSSLTSLDLSSFKTENVTDMSYMFWDCPGLTSLDLSSFKTDNVTNMYYMFSSCSALTTIYVGDGWSTTKVTKSGSMFSGCTNLVGGMGTPYNAFHADAAYAHIDGGATNPGYFTDINAPQAYAVLSEGNTVLTFYYNNEKAAKGGMSVGPFTGNYDPNTGQYVDDDRGWYDARESITTVEFDESFKDYTDLTSTAYWFNRCHNLSSIKHIEYLKTGKVEDMMAMFYECSSLSNLDVTGFDTGNAVNLQYMFYGCDGLTSLDVSGFNTSKVQIFFQMFAQCTGLASLDVSKFDTENAVYMNYMFSGCSSLTALNVSLFKTGNVTDMGFMFNGCSKLTALDVSGFDTGNVTSMEAMFANCSGLTSLDVTKFNTEKVTTMYAMFYGCSSLTELNLQNFKTANVKNMNMMFQFCSGLTSLDVSGFNTGNAENISQMFCKCSGLTSLDLSNFNTEKVTKMSAMFSECSALTSINLSSFNTSNIADIYGLFNMFYGCSSLTTLDLSSFNTSTVDNMTQMFFNCGNLETIYVGDKWTTANVTSSDDMFTYSYNLKGGAGTTYDADHIDHTYAHIDEGATNPGYLTYKAPAGYEPYAVLEGNTLTFYYNNEKAAKGGMSVGPFEYSYPSVNSGWYEARESITSVVFDASFANCTTLTSTTYWFYDCSNLTTITDIQYLKTDNVTDMSSMFNNCSGLTTLDLNNFNTANVTNMNSMFSGCSKLTTLDLSSFNTQNVTSMGSMFYGCSGLTSLNLSGFNTDKVMYMGGMFEGCSNLTNLDVSNFDTGNVTSFSSMFSGCSSLTSLDLSNFNTMNVTNMYDMFSGCSSLTSLDVSNFNTGNVTDMITMFYNCSSLTSLDLSSFNTAKVTDIHDMFHNCSSLTTLNVSNFNTENVTDMSLMFSGCSNLTSLDLSNFNTANVTNMWNMFYSCSSLTTLNVSNFNTGNVTDISSMFEGCSSLTSLDVSKFNTANVTDMVQMFYRCSSLTSLDVSNFNTENVTDMRYMFGDCSSLTTLDVSNFNTENVTTMIGMFYSCTSLTTLNVSNFNTGNVTNMGWMFRDSSSLSSLDVSNFNTENVTDMDYMFYGCSGLTTIYAGEGWSTAKVTESSGMFTGCTNLVGGMGTPYDANHRDAAYAHIDGGATNPGYLTYKAPSNSEPYAVLEGNTLTFYYDDKKGDRGGMDIGPFANFSDRPWNGSHQGIVKVEFDESMKEYTGLTSTAHWFENFMSLTSVQGIENLKTDNVTDMSYMFYNCSNLEHLVISELNTSKVTDMQDMFGSCSNLKDIEIGNLFITPNVTNMAGMFSYCEQLTNLDLSGFNTAKVTDMHDMFHNCMKLMTLNVQSFNTQEVTNMGSMFYNCSALTTLDVTSFNTAKVTDMSSMFNRCLTLTTLNVSSFDVGNVLDFGGMFVGCTGLTELDLSNFDTHSATRMAGMFAGCQNLTTIYASEKWDNSHVTSGDDMFENCYNLKGGQGMVYEQGRTGVSYAHIDGGENNPGYFTDKNAPAVAEPYAVLDGNMLVFYYDTDKNAIGGMDIGPFATRFERGWNDDAGTITKVEFDESFAQYTGLTSTAYWFFDCNNLVAIDGLENLKTDEVTSMREMFMYCDKLTSLNLSSFNTTHVHDMSDMFYGCESLTILDLSSFYTLNVTDMSGMFFKNAMSVLDLSSFNTANVTNMMGMFRMCPYLTTIYVSDGWTTDNVTNGNEMFMGCQNLKGGQGTEFTQAYMGVEYAHIDGGTTNPGYLTDKNAPVVVDEIIAYGVLTDQMKKMTLYYDKNMASHTEGMTLPWGELLNGYEYNHARETLVTIDIDPSFANFNTLESSGYIFAGCMKLTAIHGLQYFVTDHMTKMQEMFASCESLTELDLSSFNTSHVTEMFAMFQGCSHLKTIIVGPGWTTAALTDEGHEMFAGCTSLVGEKGTTYSEPNFNADYAHIDGGPSNPGYLTGANVPDITEFEVDGIWYRVRQKGDHEVTVVRVMYAEEERFVPSEVQYENIHWHVTALGEKAFADLHNVAVIGVPSSIDDISVDLFNHCDHLAAIMWETNVPLTSAAMGEFNNPNLLLFMANKAGAPAGVTNIIDMSTFTADKIVLTDSESGGNDFYCPEAFKANEISYTHVYDQATKIGACQGWESIVLPFDVQTFSHETKGEIYPIASLLDEQIEYDGDKPFWLYEFTQQDEFVEADKIMANRPYIISMPNDPAYWDDYILKGRITFSAKNVEISSSHHAWPVEGNNRSFVPNFKNDDYYNPDIFLLNVGDEYEGHKPGSVFSAERDNRKAHPFEAYFVMNGNPVKRYINIFDKDASSIREIPANSRTMKGAYDLMGRKMDSETTLPRGIYIIDGKKVMVK